MKRAVTQAIKYTVVGLLMFGFLGAAAGADTNMSNRCTEDGTQCVPDCNPTKYQAQAEDDPCWLVQSPNSDWEKPFWALRVKDYRG